MKFDIVLAGIGGQGILSIAAVIAQTAVESDLFIKQSEIHGMSQRGGAVYSHLRLSDRPIFSDLIPKGEADLILSIEPLEALRYTEYLNPNDGKIISNIHPEKNIPDYPDIKELELELKKRNALLLDAWKLARQVATVRAQNMVMLGAASTALPIPKEKLEEGVKNLFSRKGEKIVEQNIKAFRAGREAVS